MVPTPCGIQLGGALTDLAAAVDGDLRSQDKKRSRVAPDDLLPQRYEMDLMRGVRKICKHCQHVLHDKAGH